jgi:hypothetical protein
MATRLAFLAEKYNLLYKGPMGGIKQRNTLDAVICLCYIWVQNVKGFVDRYASYNNNQGLDTS